MGYQKKFDERPQNIVGFTQMQRIITHMFMHTERHWWYAYDFMVPNLPLTHAHCIGYEASARFSDLMSKYNCIDKIDVFETRKEGRYRVLRPRYELFEEILKQHPDLIPLAEETDIVKRFEGLEKVVENYKPVHKKKKITFKSYAK